ncbi:unnamed protein product [Linum trigynum]|uniref:Secreted protein n=1 Tax=Linum trigynum TaxID=586398 RepID=A0AAV2CWA0_9ROSI
MTVSLGKLAAIALLLLHLLPADDIPSSSALRPCGYNRDSTQLQMDNWRSEADGVKKSENGGYFAEISTRNSAAILRRSLGTKVLPKRAPPPPIVNRKKAHKVA